MCLKFTHWLFQEEIEVSLSEMAEAVHEKYSKLFQVCKCILHNISRPLRFLGGFFFPFISFLTIFQGGSMAICSLSNRICSCYASASISRLPPQWPVLVQRAGNNAHHDVFYSSRPMYDSSIHVQNKIIWKIYTEHLEPRISFGLRISPLNHSSLNISL